MNELKIIDILKLNLNKNKGLIKLINNFDVNKKNEVINNIIHGNLNEITYLFNSLNININYLLKDNSNIKYISFYKDILNNINNLKIKEENRDLLINIRRYNLDNDRIKKVDIIDYNEITFGLCKDLTLFKSQLLLLLKYLKINNNDINVIWIFNKIDLVINNIDRKRNIINLRFTFFDFIINKFRSPFEKLLKEIELNRDNQKLKINKYRDLVENNI